MGDSAVRRRGFRPCGSAVDDRARDQRADGAVPQRRDRPVQSYDFRTLGLGYANLGTVLMLLGMPYDSDQAAPIAGALTALMTGESYAASAEMAGHWALPRLRRQPGAHAARHPQSPARGVRRRATEYEKALGRCRCRSPPTTSPTSLLERAREAWDRALALGERYGYRNAQDDVAGPDRHHRAADGLRHHRRRARFRAGQIQEARRRRLFQDRQPSSPRPCASLATRDAQSAKIEPTSWGR